jgi:hypothetical protein
MNMAGHDNPAKYFQSFVLLAVFPAGNDNFPVFLPNKYIYPIHHRITYKIQLILVSKFVFPAHLSRYKKLLTIYRVTIYRAQADAGAIYEY